MYNIDYFNITDIKNNLFQYCLQLLVCPCQRQLFPIQQKCFFLTSDQTSKWLIYIRRFVFAENVLRELFKHKCILQKGNSRSILCFSVVQQDSLPIPTQYTLKAMFSYSYAVPFEVTLSRPAWYQSPPYRLVIWIWMFFLPCLSLEKRLQNFYLAISLTCKERDMITLFFIFSGTEKNIVTFR